MIRYSPVLLFWCGTDRYGIGWIFIYGSRDKKEALSGIVVGPVHVHSRTRSHLHAGALNETWHRIQQGRTFAFERRRDCGQAARMVFFICDACQETLKKNAVDKHSQRCQQCWYLSCVDCGKVFEGEAYKKHTSCISEDQKYQGKLYQQPKKTGKKADPQAVWLDVIAAAAEEERDPTMRGVLRSLSTAGNVPRKEKKFINFLKNSQRYTSDKTVAYVWSALQERLAQANKSKDDAAQVVDKKRKVEQEEHKTAESATTPAPIVSNDAPVKKKQKKDSGEAWKSWKSAIRRSIREHVGDGGTAPLKVVRKAVCKLFAKNNEEGSKMSKSEMKEIFLAKCEADSKVDYTTESRTLALK